MIQANSLLGKQEFLLGNLEEARGFFEKGLKIAGPKGSRRAEIMRNLAKILSSEKDWKGAKELLAEARALYREDQYYSGEFRAWLDEGELGLKNDEPNWAEHCYAEAEVTAGRHKDDLLLALVWNNQGTLASCRGRPAWGLERLGRALEIFRPLGSALQLAENLMCHARALSAVGRFSAALEEVEEINRIARDHPPAEDFAREAQGFLHELKTASSHPLPFQRRTGTRS